MPLDSICLSGLTRELSDQLVGAKIDKVQQPERDMILFTLRTRGETLRLLCAVGTGNARVHITQASFENPAEPPMFCMLLRKHLIGARIAELTQPEGERMLIFSLDTRDELGFEAQKKLIVELIGRSANLILVDAEGRIIDCLRRMDFGGDAERRMLPGMLYRLPPKQNKPYLLRVPEDQRNAMIEAADRNRPPEKWLLESFSGLSPLICRELAFRCGGDYSLLGTLLTAFTDSIQAGELEPWLVYDGKKPLDFSFLALRQYGSDVRCVRTDSFSELLDLFYSARDRLEQQRRRAHDLNKSVRLLRDRQARKLGLQKEELFQTEERDTLRKTAELITANLYRIHKGDCRLICEDYYEEGSPEIEIPLDPLKSPQQNAAKLFREYARQKAAQEHLTRLIAEGEAHLDYLNSVLALIASAESEKDLSDLRRELLACGILRQKGKQKQDRGRSQAPLRFVTADGLEVLVGRSNLQNDELTTKLARRTDFWLHTQKIHGSHVILRCEGELPPPQSLEQAAILAAYYSQGRSAGKIPVDYTLVKNVRKPAGSLPGKVIYTDYRTLLVESDEELVKSLRRQA